MRLITKTACHTVQGVIMFVISNRPHFARVRPSDFEISYPNYSLNCAPVSPVTATYHYTDEVTKCQLPCLVLELLYKPWSYSFMTREIYQVQYLATLYKCKQIFVIAKKSTENAHSLVEKLRIIFCFTGGTVQSVKD